MLIDYINILSVSFVAVINIILGLLVLTRNPKNKINLVFFILASSFGLWDFTLLFYEYPILFSSFYWIKLTYVFASIFMSMTLIFSFIFPSSTSKRPLKFGISLSIIYFAYVIWRLYFNNNWILDVVADGGKIKTILGSDYLYWVLFSWLVVIWALVNFILKSIKLKGFQKVQLSYLFYGFAIWSVTVNIPDVILPLLYGNTDYFLVSSFSSLFFTLTVGYSILRHRFMEIRLVVARLLAYILLILTLGIFYAGGFFVLGSLISKQQVSSFNLAISTLLALTIAFTFQPLLRWFEKLTNRIFYKDNYKIDEILKKISQILVSTLNLEELTARFLQELKSGLRFSKAAIFILIDDKIDDVFRDKSENFTYPTSPELTKLSEKNSILIFDELDEGEEKDIMRKSSVSVFAPLRSQGKFVGYLLLGEKISGDIYYSKDIRLIEILTPELAVSLTNAQSFKKISDFTLTLEQNVMERTAKLKQVQKQEISKAKQLVKLKDEFVFIATHELRTPVTVIDGFVNLIKDEKKQFDAETMENFDAIEKASARLNQLVDDLLEISRSDSGTITVTPEPVNLIETVTENVNQASPLAEEAKVKLVSKYKDGEVMVLADKEKLKDILENLLSNAIKYNRPSGGVRVSVKSMEKYAEVEVADTGYGMSKADQKKIFTKFFRAKTPGTESVDGTGLGLFITKTLVEKMNGRISFESEEGTGTTFKFSLPLA
jgi:signal transduction histidine kinase